MTGTSYVFRKQAVESARRAGYTGFRTYLDKDEMWRARYISSDPSPATEYAAAHDFVHHAEVEEVDGQKVGVLVVNVTLDELHLEHGSVRSANPDGSSHSDGSYWFTPGMSADGPLYIVEPLVPELWVPDPPPGTRRSPTKVGHAGPRERSSAESPVKTVHRIADEMVGRPRVEVVAACVAAGVNKSTANTQYYHWQKRQQK